jgi:hypothetical protein
MEAAFKQAFPYGFFFPGEGNGFSQPWGKACFFPLWQKRTGIYCAVYFLSCGCITHISA